MQLNVSIEDGDTLAVPVVGDKGKFIVVISLNNGRLQVMLDTDVKDTEDSMYSLEKIDCWV